MTPHMAGLRRLDGIIWMLIAGVTGIVLLVAAVGGFTVAMRSYFAPASAGLVMLLGARYYWDRRNDPKLASALECTAQLAAFAAAGAPLSYLAAGAGFPLQDAAFAGIDRALGFDWQVLLAIMERWPGFHLFMRIIYMSLMLQTAAVVLLLSFTGRLSWLRVYMLAFIFAALSTIAISALLPAEGAWLHYAITDVNPVMTPVSSSSWPVFLGLRDGTFRTLMATGSEGIVTFPSLHAALAVILIAAFWGVPYARWLSAAVDSLMLAATLIDGSHYLADVLAGVGIAVPSLVAARALVARLTRPVMAKSSLGAVPTAGVAAPNG